MLRSSRSLRRGKCDAVPEGQEPSWQAGSTARLSWQFDSDCFPMTIQKPITLQEAKSIARHLRLTLRQVRSGAYRVNFRDGNEMTVYYTDNLEDAVKTSIEIARTRDVTQAVDEAVAVERVQGRIADVPLNPKSLGPEVKE
jgi:hypothetical protein